MKNKARKLGKNRRLHINKSNMKTYLHELISEAGRNDKIGVYLKSQSELA